MKVPQSVRSLYDEILPAYLRLANHVNGVFREKIHRRWHYESRIKEEESYAQKLETGREPKPRAPEDMFAATIVVENHSRIHEAEERLADDFEIKYRRPKKANSTHLRPYSFDFDDLRLYLSLKPDPMRPPSDLIGVIFELQIKTYLQHAWGIATHDLVYKSDEVNWGAARVAYQVKAMLENAELSISEAKLLTDSSILSRRDFNSESLTYTIERIKERWESSALPGNLLRLASTISELKERIVIKDWGEFWQIVDEATQAGRGAKLLDLSPYAAILDALVAKKGGGLFDRLADAKPGVAIFVPLEIDLPELSPAVAERIIRPDRV